MNKRYHILSLIAALILTTIQVNAQYADIVCAGSTRVYKTTGNAGSTFHWTIDGGGTITNPVGDSIEVLWGDKAGEYHIQVVQTTKYGCKGAPLVATIKLVVPPSVELGTDVKMCSGQTVALDAGDGFTSYTWNNGTSTRLNVISSSGIYKVVATDAFGCSMADSVNVVVSPSPKVNLGRDTSLCENETYELFAGTFTDTLQYLWSDGSVSYSKIASTNDFPMVSVAVTTLEGCVATDSVVILPCDLQKYFDNLPNTITPNGDGKNDTWEIPLLENYPNAKVQIYDRWGRVVFQSSHGLPAGGWDGTSNGRILPMDSYHYIIDLKSDGMKFRGILTIVR